MQSLALLKLLLFDWSFSALKCTCFWGRGGRGENAGLGSKRSPRRAFLLLEAVHALQNGASREGWQSRALRAEPGGVWGDTAKGFAEQRVFTHGPPAKGGLVLIFLDIEESIGP